jgi:hypothetical protein
MKLKRWTDGWYTATYKGRDLTFRSIRHRREAWHEEWDLLIDGGLYERYLTLAAAKIAATLVIS